MNYRTSFNSRFIGYMVILGVGWVGVAVATPVMAQHSSEETRLLMAQASSIAGSWRLVNMTESSTPTPMVPPQNTELTAEFSGDRISGSGGCNRFMGDYQTEGEQLSIGALASTFMACEEPVMNQEMKYLAALQGAQRYQVNEPGELEIFYQTGQESGVLRFTSQTTSQTIRALW